LINQYLTKGHNVAALLSFGRIFGTEDITASILGIANFGKDELSQEMLSAYGIDSFYLNTMTLSAMLNYSPVDALQLGAGPYLTWQNYESKPVLSLKLSASLGGGKF